LRGTEALTVDLAGRKLLALLDPAAARDLVDVFTLANRYGKQVLDEGVRRIGARQLRTHLRRGYLVRHSASVTLGDV